MYDYVIIGSGIVGSFIARELSRYQVSVLLVEKENDFANYQTIANSGIIHSGHDPQPNTLKAKLCVRGNELYRKFEQELQIPLLKTGAFVVAHDQKGVEKLKELHKRALINEVPFSHLVEKKQLKKEEPNLADTIIKALSLPTTMVTFPWEVAFHALENAHQNGVALQKNSKVTNLYKKENYYIVEINKKDKIQTKAVINASGIYSDEITAMLESKPAYQIRPKRGEYYVLDKRVKGWMKHVIYPLPTHLGKGILIVPQVHGNILLGPTSIPQQSKESLATTIGGLMLVKAGLKELASDIPYRQVIRQFAGLRASSTYEDFYIQESQYYPRFYQVAGIDSPGLSAAPAIAEFLIEQVLRDKHPIKSNFQPSIAKQIHYFDLSHQEQQRLFTQNKQYGNIICKCEHITEAEVVAAIKGPLGSDSIKGIKKRVRAGAGLCQGGYCEREVLKIIARETNQPLEKINYYTKDSSILDRETKVRK